MTFTVLFKLSFKKALFVTFRGQAIQQTPGVLL